MREILTIIAACLVAVLCAALAVPPFVDWDSRVGQIEAQVAAATGGVAKIAGPVALRLLPAPRLSVGALAVERPGLKLVSQAAVFELSPTALLRGKLDFTEASLDRAEVEIAPASFAPAAARGAGASVAKLTIRDGALRIAGPRPLALDHVDLTAALDSFAGPFRGAGTWKGGRDLAFTFSTGAIEAGRLRAKLTLDAPDAAAHAEIDGDILFAQDMPAFAGHATANGAGAQGVRTKIPWRAAFGLRAAPDALHADSVEIRIGDDEHALAATGSADYAPGAPVVAKLAARNLDLDRFRAAYDASGPVAAAWAPPLRLDLAAESATLGGATLAAPSLKLDLATGAPAQATLDADLPGRAHVHYSGSVDFAGEMRLDGDVRLAMRDPRVLSDWLAPAAPDFARLIAVAPFARTEISARIAGGGGAFAARAIEAELDRSRFAGAFEWAPAQNGSRAKLTARLTSGTIDLDGLPQFAALPALGGGVDLSVALDAQAVKVARFGKASVDAGRIRLQFARDADSVRLERLSIENLGGATLAGSGRFAARGGGLDLKLDADRLDDLAGLVRRIAPGAASEAFLSRASALSPAHLTLGIATNARAELAQLNLAGEAGGTKVSAQLQPARADSTRLEFFLRADADESAGLLRQIGLPALPLKGFGRATIEAQGAGAFGGPLRTKMKLAAAGAKLDFDGETSLALDRAAANGRARFETRDLAPLIQMLALGAPDQAQRLPAQGEGRLSLGPDGFAIEDGSASVAGAQARGRVSRRDDGTLRGELTLDSLPAPFLAALVLGPAQPAPAGALWSHLKFAPAPLDPPAADLDLTIARLDLGGVDGRDVRVKLALAPGALAFSELNMKFGDGLLAGAGALRREGGAALATLRLAVGGVALAAGPFAARMSGRIDASGAGASMNELIGALAGTGHVRWSDARIERAAADAPARVVAALERDEAPVEQQSVVRALESALDAAAQTPDSFESDLSLAAGRLTAAPVFTREGAAQIHIGGAFDLRTGLLDLRESLAADAGPAIEIGWSGRPSAPVRRLGADLLVAALAERAIARENARNAALEADIRERAFFNRRLKSDRRLDEERRAAAEAARIEKERAERERRASEIKPADLRRAPSAFSPAPGGAPPDPSTAGRY